MEAERILEIATATWGLAMAVSPGLQIRQMLRTGESEDVSIGYFAVLSVGFALWAAYGISTGVPILYLCNAVAFVFGIAAIVVAKRLRVKPQSMSEPRP